MLNRPVKHFAARVMTLDADMKLSGRETLFVEFDFALLRNGYRVTCALTAPGGPGRDGLPIPAMSASWQDYEATRILGDLLRGEINPGGDGLDYLRGPLGPRASLHKSGLRLDEDFTWMVEVSMRKSWNVTDISGSLARFLQAMDDHFPGHGDSILEGLSERFCPEPAEAEPAPDACEPAF